MLSLDKGSTEHSAASMSMSMSMSKWDGTQRRVCNINEIMLKFAFLKLFLSKLKNVEI